MPALPATPLFMRDVLLTFKLASDVAGTELEYQCNVSEARIQTTPGETVSVKTLCAEGSFSSQGKPSYSLIISGIQDWNTTAGSEGLAAFLWANAGEILDFTLQAYGETQTPDASHPQMTGQVTAAPGDYGGEIDTYAELSVELPCVSKPQLVSTGSAVAA